MATQVEHLLALAQADTAAALWLREAIGRLIDGDSWTAATGIQPSAIARAVRDQHLRRAAELIGGDPIELHRLAGRFESDLWPRWRRFGLPADAGLVNKALYQARTAAPFPSSSRQFRRIVQ